ncbi:MAG: calcium-translocating P-type ATPase, PMCA-type [Planctomycetia bacterium]|nr:calcium-translocating P-type ATPase, PMCA-type [Planctomycetia bacterium]
MENWNRNRGLTQEQVAKQRQRFGRNELTPPQRTPWWKELLGKFKDPTIRILLAAAVISLGITATERYALGNTEVNFLDSIGIFLAVLLATLVGFFSERKSAKEFALLNRVKEDITVKVLRDGQIGNISIGDVVAGDLVRIDPGDKIPADGVVLEAMGLTLDQSMMTGESVPAKKKIYTEPLDLERLPEVTLGDDAFVARGTMVVDGYGTFWVTRVGDKTQMGQIAMALAQEDETRQETPLTAKLSTLARQISVAGIVGAMGIFTVMAITSTIQSPLLGMLECLPAWVAGLSLVSLVCGIGMVRQILKPFFAGMGMELKSVRYEALAAIPMVVTVLTLLVGFWGMTFGGNVEAGVLLLKEVLLAFVVAVTIIVVAVPEGLPMMVTVSLAMNMMKMARENCLVRRLVASETIGSATVICTDKTGTLTQNRMTPVRIYAGGNEYPASEFTRLQNAPEWQALVEGIAVNSEANLHVENDTVTAIGNPTEGALLKFLHEHQTDYLSERNAHERVFELGHNSERKMSLVAVRDGDRETGYLKGAPERILSRCSTMLQGGERVPIMPHREAIQNVLDAASQDALRVLAFCEFREHTPVVGDAWLDLCDGCFVALVGIADPVRQEVPHAVQTCQEAHVQVKMITGDALPTAMAIARAAGIYHGTDDELCLDSSGFAQISDAELPEAAEKIRVLARSTPMDKLRLVKALHQNGEVVAMTGDGTNDAPALKYADVGLSMGITGTEVAKEASDIVLVDDNFKSIVTGVWWGRTLYQNIQRFLQFQLSVNAVAMLCALIGPLVGIPLPLTVTQLLWINIIMDTFAAMAYSTDPPRPHTMREKPIPRNAHIITRTMGMTILVASLYQVAILFAVLFGGWFVDPGHRYDFGISPTHPEYLAHNLQALTVFFTVLIMFQFWHKFNCRALHSNESPFTMITKNHLFLGIILSITAVQILMVQNRTIGQFFRTEPLSLRQWLDITLLTLTVLPVAWFGRFLGKLLEKKEP